MTDRAHEQVRVGADPARCFALATDFAGYPRWAGDVKEVEVRERDTDGRGTRVAYRVAAIGRSIRYVLDYDYSDAPGSFSWALHESDQVRTLDGRYTFRPDGDGTVVDYELAVDLAMPLPSLVTRRAAGIIVRTALGDFRRAVETTVVTPAAADGPEAADVQAPGDAGAAGTPEAPPDTSPPTHPEAPPDTSPPTHPEAVPFEDVGRDAPPPPEAGSPAGTWCSTAWFEALAHELLGAVPEVRDHAIEAADAALAALRALLDAAERALDRQRDDGDTRS